MARAVLMCRALVVGCAIGALCACAPLAPWERGVLAQPRMAPVTNPAQHALRTHLHESREAASGSANSAGGGCGCT